MQMFRKNGVAIAAQWSAASGTWIEVGEVTGTSNAGVIDGKPALADPRHSIGSSLTVFYTLLELPAYLLFIRASPGLCVPMQG